MVVVWKIFHHRQGRFAVLDSIYTGKRGSDSSSKDISTIVHCRTDLTLVNIVHWRRNQVPITILGLYSLMFTASRSEFHISP